MLFFVPKTGEIRWLETGPWLNQHDINDLGDGRYSVFGNNHVRPNNQFLDGHSEIYIFNPTSDEIETSLVMTNQIKSMALALGNIPINIDDTHKLHCIPLYIIFCRLKINFESHCP